MIKNSRIKPKKIFLSMTVMLLLGFLLLNLSTTTVAIPNQAPNDTPIPGVPFLIPGNGSSVELIPGEQLILETPSGVSVSLTVNESVSISINETNTLPKTADKLPNDTFGIGVYLEIETNVTTNLNATLSLPYDQSDLPPGVAEEQLYFAFYNASTGEWQGVPSWVDTNKGEIYGNTTHFSTWTVMAPQQGPPLDIPKPGIPFEVPVNGTPVTLVPGESLILETPSGIQISLIVGKGVNISINVTTNNPAGDLPTNATSIGKYLQIELNDSDVEVDATLSMPYQDGDIPPGAAEEQLYFVFYNASTGQWQGVPSWVDTTNNIVYANTTHFSTWTVLGETESTTTTTSDSSSTNGDTSTNPSTTSSSTPISLWFDIQNVKDGFLISFSGLSLLLVVIAITKRRKSP
ncbi:MAG: hypothetical protein ACTSW1_16415 [Candidatus Hodarchaeales archaeon]